jgi:hypothetical protein
MNIKIDFEDGEIMITAKTRYEDWDIAKKGIELWAYQLTQKRPDDSEALEMALKD